MKILYFITGLRLGGAERQLLLLAKQIQLSGNVVLVVAMESNGAMVDDFSASGIGVDGLGVKGGKSLLPAYRKFKKIIASFKPDIIHSHMIHANIFASFFKMFNSRVKLICTAHNIREGNSAAMAAYHFIKKIANWATNVSKEAYDFYVSKKYFDPQKSSFIPNAIDVEVFDPAKYHRDVIRRQLNVPQNAYVFFSAGRLHYQKNYPVLLKAFAAAKKNVPNALLYIAGTGPDLAALQQLRNELSINESVVFLGRRNDIPALMSMCDCFVLSSHYEGFGLVIAEAMAMQVPVISTDCGGVKEVMGGLGTLIDVEDMAGFSAAMVAVSRIGSYCHSSSRRRVEENYSIPAVIDKWKELYKCI